jgi:hypothetical protein
LPSVEEDSPVGNDTGGASGLTLRQMNQAPAVSVVTATYNRSNVLRYAIESVLAQSFRDWEIIVIRGRLHGRHGRRRGFL